MKKKIKNTIAIILSSSAAAVAVRLQYINIIITVRAHRCSHCTIMGWDTMVSDGIIFYLSFFFFRNPVFFFYDLTTCTASSIFYPSANPPRRDRPTIFIRPPFCSLSTPAALYSLPTNPFPSRENVSKGKR